MSSNLNLLLWVLGTWLIGFAALNVTHKSGAGQIAKLTQATASGLLLAEVAAFIFYVGIPFVALILGVLGLDHMALGQAQPDAVVGFTAIEWLRGLGITLSTTTFVLVVLWLMARSCPSPVPTGEGMGVGAIIRVALYAEVHWAFYRSLGAQAFNDPYWGAVLGFGLIGLEWMLHPNFRAQAQSTHGRTQLALQLVCLITSSALYLGAQNLWLIIAAHALILAAGQRWLFPHAPIQNAQDAHPA
jgi:hypothetical protein